MGLERQARVPTMREERRFTLGEKKESGVVRKWYARFLMRLEARGLATYRISRANPSLGRRRSGGRVGRVVEAFGGIWIRGAKVREFIRIGIGRRLTRLYYVPLLAK